MLLLVLTCILQMYDNIAETLKEAADDKNIAVAVITGNVSILSLAKIGRSFFK